MTKPRQRLVKVVLVALVVSLPCQLSLRQWGLRLAGVQTGIVSTLESENRVSDEFATWEVGALVGLRIATKDGTFEIVESGHNWFALEAGVPQVGHTYVLAKDPDSALARIAIRMPSLPVTFGSLFLGLLCLLSIPEFIAWIKKDAARSFRPTFGLLAGAWLLFSAVRGGAGGAKDLLQVVEFGLLVLVLILQCRSETNRELVVKAVVFGATLAAACGLVDYGAILGSADPSRWLAVGSVDGILGIDWQASRPHVRGSAGSRNAFAYYIALVVPVLVACILSKRAVWLRVLATLSGGALLVCCLNLWLLLLAVLAAGVVAAGSGNWYWRMVPAGAVLIICCFAIAVPKHIQILADSAAVYRYADVYGQHPKPLTGAHADDADIGDWSPWQQRAVERQAALNAVMVRPGRGAGLGRYQTVINQFYSDGPDGASHLWVPKPAVNLMERDAHAVWLVLAVEGGVILPLLLLLAIVDVTAVCIRRKEDVPEGAGLWVAWALLLVLGGFVSSFMVRGLFGVAGVLVVLAVTAPWLGSCVDKEGLDAEDHS